MKLTITIDLDNEAFKPDWTLEASRTLLAFGALLSTYGELASDHPIRDSNGNTVGVAVLEK